MKNRDAAHDRANERSGVSASRVPPEFARLSYGDTLKLAEREEVFVDGDLSQPSCPG
jgi:hypothetical protein